MIRLTHILAAMALIQTPPVALPDGPALTAAAAVLRAGGAVYLEAPVAWDDVMAAACGLVVVRHLKAGMVHAHLMRLAGTRHA